MARVLVIDADPDVRQLLAYDLGAAGHEVLSASSAEEGLKLARCESPDLVLSELALPDASGAELCRRVRGEFGLGEVPFLILSAQNEEVDRVVAFELGVDDFVSKPFSPRELVLRVRAMLRRSGRSRIRPQPAQIGALRLDRAAHRTWVFGREIQLTATEFMLLVALQQSGGRVLTRESLVEDVWGGDRVDERTVDAHIKRLRRRLGAAADCVETVRGVGYRFADDASLD